MSPKDMTGMRFGRLVVARRDGSIGNRAAWHCHCDCGGYVRRSGLNLRVMQRRGIVQGCGCTFTESSSRNGRANVTHGHSQSKLYDVWRQMLRRCEDVTCKDYPNWGGRGIAVCDEWHSVDSFVIWARMAGYCEGLTIERINNMLGYSPDNCRWIPNEWQAKNTRRVLRITARGKTMTVAEWCSETGIAYRCLLGRLSRGWSHERAVAP